MPFKILNTLDISGAPEARAALEEVGTLTSLPAIRETVLPALRDVDAYLASASIRIDADFLDHAPKLRVIGSPSTGKDHMELAEIQRRGIIVYDIATEYDLINSFSATSEMAFALVLALIRKLVPAQADAKLGKWTREKYTGFQLLGKTLGIIGLGRLGRISARIGQGFGMSVVAHDTAPTSVPGVEMVPLSDLLKRADIVSIHVHLKADTEGLIDKRAFDMMKPTAILVNTSRGRIVDEMALLEALQSRRIAGAALDVVDGEWMLETELYSHPLISYSRTHDNLLIVPHIGGATVESIYGARVFMARKLANHLRQSR